MRFLPLATSLLLLGPATAQFFGPGLSWAGTSGNGTRSFVPTCQNLRVTAVPGETVTLTIWGDPQAPFALFAATSGSQCLVFPGINNGLVLDFPVETVLFGVLTQQSPCLACPPGMEALQIPIPNGLPPGTALSVQAASIGNRALAFTTAITATI